MPFKRLDNFRQDVFFCWIANLNGTECTNRPIKWLFIGVFPIGIVYI